MKKRTKTLYKTIKAIRYGIHLFDIDTGKFYKLISIYGLPRFGYFLIGQVDKRWIVVKVLTTREKKDYQSLPYFTRVQFSQFVISNYGLNSATQKVIDSLDL